MKEKTFKDLGLDEGDNYLKKLATDFDLEALESILENKEDEKELNEHINNIKKEI